MKVSGSNESKCERGSENGMSMNEEVRKEKKKRGKED